VSTRDEILHTLKAHPQGLTSKELAPHCPACECDPMVVGRNIAQLHADNLIRPGTQLRNGSTVWLHGGKTEEVREAPITLASGMHPPAQSPAAAAQAIADMRRHNTHADGRPTVREQIEKALRLHGPMTSTEIGAAVDNDDARQHCSSLAQRGVLVRLGGSPKAIIYGIPGQSLKDRKIITSQPVAAATAKEILFNGKPPPGGALVDNVKTPAKGHGAAAQSGSRNGGGGAEAPAAGPAVDGALRELNDKRAHLAQEQETLFKRAEELGAQIAKVDRAIDALGALA
jgi:hypothetical protein